MNRFAVFILILLCSCASDTYDDIKGSEEISLKLKWNKAYPDDSIDKSIIGLKWALSYVGAELPTTPYGVSAQNNTITLDFNQLGFSEKAKQKLSILNEKIKLTEEYKTTGAIDLGRFVSLLIGASEHYYEITGVPKRLDELMGEYTLLPEKGFINHSSVSLEHRIIQFSEQNEWNQVFISSEVDPVSGKIYEYETIEIIPNGQIRFGIFDADGTRRNNADPLHSKAGKPAKCFWCHESNIQQLHSSQDDFPNFIPYLQLQNKLIDYNQYLNSQRLKLTKGVDYSQTQQHTYTELLYISFMEPSAERLSFEWGISVAQVQKSLSGLPTHIYTEFPFLGNLYFRNDIEKLAPFQSLSVSTNVREQSTIEVNHLN